MNSHASAIHLLFYYTAKKNLTKACVWRIIASLLQFACMQDARHLTIASIQAMARYNRGILITGGGTFLGDSIAAALLAEGAAVSLLVRPGSEDRLGPLARQTRWSTADVWNPASLRGKARSHSTVIHTVGSLNADPARGLSYHRLNFLSARSVANMCVSDGVEHLILMSAAQAPWISRRYIRSKRAAESYLRRSGLRTSIIRAPLVYRRGGRRPLFYRLMTLLGGIPPFSRLMFGRIAPMPIDLLAGGVARIALSDDHPKSIYYRRDLRRRSQNSAIRQSDRIAYNQPPESAPGSPFQALDEDLPFGWTPTDRRP